MVHGITGIDMQEGNPVKMKIRVPCKTSAVPASAHLDRDTPMQNLRCIVSHVPNLKSMLLGLHSIRYTIRDQFIDQKKQIEVCLKDVDSLKLQKSFHIPLKTIFLNELFAMLPNVKFLELKDMENDLDFLVEDIEKLNLQGFYTSLFSFPVFLAIGNTQKLKELSIQISDKAAPIQGQGQEELLQSQAACLETLILKNQSKYSCKSRISPFICRLDYSRPKLKLPVMKKLKNLTLYHVYNHEDEDQAGAFPVIPIEATQVPELNAVLVSAYLLSNGVFASDSTFTSVRELHLKYWSRDDGDGVLENIFEMFPNLTQLTGFCSKMDSEDVNLFFSGVPRGHGWMFSQLAERVGAGAVLPHLDPPGISLKDFKGLSCLKLFFKGDCDCVIDEIPVYLTFLRLSPQLHLTLDGDFSTSAELAAKLTEYSGNFLSGGARRFEEKCDPDSGSDSDLTSDSDSISDSSSTSDSEYE